MRPHTFIDLFSGCGGLSLGLMNAGWSGLFAVEKSPDAFETLWHNLYNPERPGFAWPGWLEAQPIELGELLSTHKHRLESLSGTVDLVAGGPPCQGFSFAGRRNPDDPRNNLPSEYVQAVSLIRPRFLLLENVKGFASGFSRVGSDGKKYRTASHAAKVSAALADLGYIVFSDIVFSSEVGVPQLRRRLVILAVRKDDPALGVLNGKSPFDLFHEMARDFKMSKGLPPDEDITTRMAISDLETRGKTLIPCKDSSVPGFSQIDYRPDINPSAFQALMRAGLNGEQPDSLRLPRHTRLVSERFKLILQTCERGKSISKNDRVQFGLKKHHTVPLHPDKLSSTVTTLPDDLIHYSEPRILTVREMARLQTFPDWFSFKGRYTTGNTCRREQCPRYTQVGNAVPPLLAEALGRMLFKMITPGN